jgi:GTP-binding protein HflX
LSRDRRRRNETPTVSLVGYTNAGKSTLFNTLTESGVLVADMLFATLDPTLRSVQLPTGERFVLADTVGFIRELPHELVAAFRSTLEETRAARLLLHVVDASDPTHQDRIEDVEKVLREIGAGELPVLRVYNKADRIEHPPRLDRSEIGLPARVWLSASTGAGVDLLRAAIAEFLHQDKVRGVVRLGVSQARLRAIIYREGAVQGERPLADGGWELDVEMDRRGFMSLQRSENLCLHKDASTRVGTAV